MKLAQKYIGRQRLFLYGFTMGSAFTSFFDRISTGDITYTDGAFWLGIITCIGLICWMLEINKNIGSKDYD